MFEKSLQYVKRFSRYKNPDAVRQVREYPLFLMFFILWDGGKDGCAHLLYAITNPILN